MSSADKFSPDLMTEEANEYPRIPGAGEYGNRAYIGPVLFTKVQAAEMLNLAATSVDWLLRKGAVPHRKIAGKIRFTRSDLQALIEASAVTQCCAAEQKGA